MSLVKLLRKKCRKSLFTTPSHSQELFIFHKLKNMYRYDISETDFHNPQKALEEAENHAAEIYGTKCTKFLTNGSSSGIIASVLACAGRDEKVLIWRNAHPSHHNAVILAGAEPVYYDLGIDSEWGVPASVSADYIESFLKTSDIKAVIVTSPSYEGFVSDISAIKKVCGKYGAYLIVDEAHGALYPFSEKLPESAVKIADFTIQSLHKTAGGLNPTALVHSNIDSKLDYALNLISTTSPSYPLLASIEATVNYLNSKRGRKKLENLIINIQTLRNECRNCVFGGDDITKILIRVPGLSGFELSEILFDRFNIEDEKTNEKSTMLLCGIGTSERKLERLSKALKHICKDM